MSSLQLSTVWAALSAPYSASGSIPFVASNGYDINSDVLNFSYISGTGLFIGNNGDMTGTDTINAYKSIDLYEPNSVITSSVGQNSYVVGGNNNVPTVSVSTSRGTGSAPTASYAGDFVGKFSGFNYAVSSNITNGQGYTEVASVSIDTVNSGYSANGVYTGVGGRINFNVSVDTGIGDITVASIYNDTSQKLRFTPRSSANPITLGAPSSGSGGWNGIYLNYVISGISGSVIINAPAGKVIIPAGNNSITITNSMVSTNTIVHCQVETVDSTLYYVCCTPGNGNFVITGNANATSAVTISFVIIGTNT